MSSKDVHYQILVATAYSRAKAYSYVRESTIVARERQDITALVSQCKPSYRGREVLPDFVRPISPHEAIVSLGLRIVGRSHSGTQKGLYAIKIHTIECG